MGRGLGIGIGVGKNAKGPSVNIISGSKDFNGSSDVIDFGAVGDLSGDFWIYGKVNVSSMGNYRAIFSKQDGTNYEVRMAFNSTGRLYIWVFYGGSASNSRYFRTGSGAFSAGAEYEIFFSYDASAKTAILTRNGSVVGTESSDSGSITTVSKTDADSTIGAIKTGASSYTYYFPGEIIKVEAGVGYFTTYGAAGGAFLRYLGT